MMKQNYKGQYRKLIIPVVILCLSGIPINADTEPYSMNITAGFSNVLKWGNFIPVTITIRNNTKPTPGTLIIETIQGNAYGDNLVVMHYSQKVNLSTGIPGTYHFTLDYWNFAFPLSARLMVDNTIVAQNEIDILSLFTSNRLILCLSTYPILSFFTHAQDDSIPVQVLYPSIHELPVSYKGYDMIDMIVVHDMALDSIQPDQVDALEKWIARGGRIIMSGTQLSGPLQRFIPVQITGFTRKDNLVSLEKKYHYPLPPGPGFPLMRIIPDQGTIILEEDNIPLLIKKEYDQGIIYLCSFDFGIYPFSEWEGRLPFWNDILGPVRGIRQTGEQYDREKFEDDSLYAFVKYAGIHKTINFTGFYILIVLYCAVMLVLPPSLLFKGNPSFKWIAIFTVSIIFAAGGWFIVSYGISKGVTSEGITSKGVTSEGITPGEAKKSPGRNAFHTTIAVIAHNNESTYSNVNYYTGFFTFRDMEFGIRYADEINNPRFLFPAGTRNPSYTIEVESGKIIRKIRPGKWTSIQVNAWSTIKFPLKISLDNNKSHYTLVIENDSVYTMYNSLLFLDNSVYPLNTILPDTVFRKEYSQVDKINILPVLETLSPLQKAAFETYAKSSQKNIEQGYACVFGWIRDFTDYPLVFPVNSVKQEVCFVEMKIPVITMKEGEI